MFLHCEEWALKPREVENITGKVSSHVIANPVQEFLKRDQAAVCETYTPIITIPAYSIGTYSLPY